MKHTRSHSFFDSRQRSQQTCSVQHERFLAPELFFRPDFISNDYTTPLPQVQACFLSAALYGAALSQDQTPGLQLDSSRTLPQSDSLAWKALSLRMHVFILLRDQIVGISIIITVSMV